MATAALLRRVRAGDAGHEDVNEQHFQPSHLLGMLWVTSSVMDRQQRGGSMAVGELGFVEVALGHKATRVRGKGGFERRRHPLCWPGVAAALACGPREVQRALGVGVGLLVRLGRLLEKGDDGRIAPVSDSERRGANVGCGEPKGKLGSKG
jgi:hypothetical protein